MPSCAELLVLAAIAPIRFMRDHPTACPECGAHDFRTLDETIAHMQKEHPR